MLKSRDWRDLLYNMGTNPVHEVWCRGKRVVSLDQNTETTAREGHEMSKSFWPTLLYQDGALSGKQLDVDDAGRVTVTAGDPTQIYLKDKALLPGFVNAHSHSFQRLIRGRAESRAVSGKDFWSWRNTMYQAAAHLSPEEVYDVARMCYLEMVHAGITTVGEFHYLHNTPDGTPYDDPNLIARQVIAAAQSVGLRIVLLRSAYLRSGYQLPTRPRSTPLL